MSSIWLSDGSEINKNEDKINSYLKNVWFSLG